MKSITLFIVPLGAQGSLTDDGWMFASDMTLSPRVIDKVISYFNVHLVEEYLGIRKYQNQQTQISVVFNEEGAPSEVSLRTAPDDCVLESLRVLLADEAVNIVDSKGADVGGSSDAAG